MTNPYDLIQQYLDGFLKGKELQDFERQLQSDKVLAEEVELMKELRPAVALHQRIEGKETALKETLAGLGERHFKEEVKVMNIRRVLAIAASILFLVISFWWVNNNYSNRALISNFYEPLLDYKKANISEDEALLTTAKEAFFSKQYAIAISSLKEIPQSASKSYYEAQGLLAYSLFDNQNFEQAIPQFTLLIEKYYEELPIEFRDKNRLRWSRLLAHVGNNRADSSFFETELTYFLNHDSQIYKEKAQRLEKKVNSKFRHITIN